jgi:hypothetical protein
MSDFYKDESFNLPIEYNGREIILPGTLKRRGYSYKIHIEVNEQEIIFEPDEERNFRAISENNNFAVPLDIILAIGKALEKYLR